VSTFAYLGQPLTAEEFGAYVEAYNFGSIPPDYLVFHHTAIPGASWARMPGREASDWDRGEAGLSETQIKAKRMAQLDGIMRYYRDTLGWSAGPHLFVDNKWVWLFTPMYEVGIHAAQGNSYRDRRGLHYSIGLEVIGYYEATRWPPAVEELVGHVVATLQRRLGTFQLEYRPWAGGLSAHRDYNKPSCPGLQITPDYYVNVCRAAAARLTSIGNGATFINQ